jgi:hypothetical protein
MIGLPHRVGAAYVVLGQANGTEPRTGHILNSNQYGGGSVSQFHTYYGNYPESTTPDYIITKVAGTLGEDYTYTSPSSENIPGNILKIVSYKTELNHYLPNAAKDADFNLPTYSSQPLLVPIDPVPPGSSGYYIPGDFWGNESVYISEQLADFNTLVAESFVEITDVTDNINGDVEGFTPSVFYPRWTAESGYEREGQLNLPISVTLGSDETFYQTREGPAMTAPSSQVGVYWTQPWGIGRVPESGLNERLNIDCNVSYKFTVDGEYASGSIVDRIVYPWGKYAPDPENPDVGGNFLGTIADECAWQYSYDAYAGGLYSQKYPEGAYRTVPCPRWPIQEGQDYPYVNYENTATHGLFLAANGSCWNIGTELTVKVHIWKAPPKFCLYYRNKDKDGGGSPYFNWQTGYPLNYPVKDYVGGYPNASGPVIGTGTFVDGDFRFEGGTYSGVEYSIPEPKPLNLHYWGEVFAPDTDSEDCEEHEVLEFTVTIDESNTYQCDGTPREDVEMTPWGFKAADIVIPPVEGFITYIKDFEVTSVKKPPATP